MDAVKVILRRFVGFTIMLSIFLLVLNIVMLSLLISNEIKGEDSPKSVLQNVVASLHKVDAGYALDDDVKDKLRQNQAWAMLLNKEGDVDWEYLLPAEIPRTFSVIDVAKFSRSYLMGYPVFVWEHSDSLVVVGFPKQSYAKYHSYFLVQWVSSLPLRIVLMIVGNIAIVLLLSIIIGTSFVKSVKPLIEGVHALSKENPIHVEAKGIFSDLAYSINYTSDMLQEKNESLKMRDEARSNWITGISHDIRTPLSMILGYASELEESSDVSDEQRRQAGIIRQQGEKLRSLIADLNLVSKLEYEMQPLNLEVTRLSAIARQVTTDFLNNGLDDRYQINLNVTGDHAKILADRKLLMRAVTNLVQNSINHNPQGCTIELAIHYGSGHLPCQFIVCDNGVGISNLDLKDLLELPYSSQRKTPVRAGHGLGLPMVARIVSAHQGELSLRSGYGQGLVVTMFFPSI
ncbi:sensor histidine kinase [Paenibacillus lentus]|uniref:histidine kinase n=1 Tax=Paenibacillus lentus TaxID=1338368 RepID=A0A3S8RVY5_9BACL|nr:HAMP domain-containing sensor histidine kinase [Paenibacillus lentus]AZK47305.1 sensor histidine kinase [Paenibacillus lentus]